MGSSKSYHLRFGLYIVAHIILKEVIPLGGYQYFLKCKFAARSIIHAAIPALIDQCRAALSNAKLELTPLQADKSHGLLFGNDAVGVLHPM